MFCKNCGTELEEGLTVCPSCGEQQGSMDKKLKIAVTVLCIALLAVVLAIVVVMSMKNKKQETPDTGNTQTVTQTEGATEETQAPALSGSYTASDDVLKADRDQVVAKFGNYEMTVADLQLNYWFQVYMYYENNDENIAYGYIKLDVTKPLDQQPCTENPNMTWQQFFLNKALTTWKSYAAMNMMADESGFEMPPNNMDNLKADTLLEAQAAGFETADAYVLNMLRKDVGATVEAQDYWNYMGFVNRATLYFADWYEKALPTDAEIDLYYKENEKMFVDGGAGKDAGNIVDVRHILVMVENDDWAAAEKEANEILQQFKAGGATEELFAQLANQYSDDSGSNTTGGLYTGVQPGKMVEVFDNWIMDDSRQTGDTAVLKADYYYKGYHVMYFVSGQPIWKTAVEQTMISERSTEMVQKTMEKWTMEQFEENFKLGTPAFE